MDSLKNYQNLKKRKSASQTKNEVSDESPTLTKHNDLLETLKSTLSELNDTSNEIDVAKIAALDSFKSIEKLESKAHKKAKKRSILTLIVDNYDIVFLCILNLVFLCYLAFFVTTYVAPDSNFAISFYEFNVNLFKATTKYWLGWNGLGDEIDSEVCAIPVPSFIGPVLRPIDNCNMCIGLNEIKRVANISQAEFLEKYAYTGVPVIVSGNPK